MHKFGKVVLSRKGFDSSAGGEYSPFDPQTGRYIVLPIPVGKKELEICNPLKYEDIHLQGNHLDGYPETNLKSLMKAMGKEATLQTKGKKEESEYAHFDPWLGHCPWLAEHSNHQIGAFGQVGGAQTHLDKQDVGKGSLPSLFLFFSRFKPIGQNRENIIVPDIGDENLKEGLYFIYGWLKVKKVIQKYKDISDPNLKSYHPHATEKYFDEKYARKNTIYIADEFLSNDGSNIPGCGYFPELNEYLLLTAPDQEQGEWSPTLWSLPDFFCEKCRSVLKGKGQVRDGLWLVGTNWQWQEAVFDESEEFCRWFRSLLESC
jgi:hypothetical protein